MDHATPESRINVSHLYHPGKNVYSCECKFIKKPNFVRKHCRNIFQSLFIPKQLGAQKKCGSYSFAFHFFSSSFSSFLSGMTLTRSLWVVTRANWELGPCSVFSLQVDLQADFDARTSIRFPCRLDTRSLHSLTRFRDAGSTSAARSILSCSISSLQWQSEPPSTDSLHIHLHHLVKHGHLLSLFLFPPVICSVHLLFSALDPSFHVRVHLVLVLPPVRLQKLVDSSSRCLVINCLKPLSSPLHTFRSSCASLSSRCPPLLSPPSRFQPAKLDCQSKYPELLSHSVNNRCLAKTGT